MDHLCVPYSQRPPRTKLDFLICCREGGCVHAQIRSHRASQHKGLRIERGLVLSGVREVSGSRGLLWIEWCQEAGFYHQELLFLYRRWDEGIRAKAVVVKRQLSLGLVEWFLWCGQRLSLCSDMTTEWSCFVRLVWSWWWVRLTLFERRMRHLALSAWLVGAWC